MRRSSRRRLPKRWHIELPVVREETWDNGEHIIFHEVPFPVGRKPFVPERAHDDAYLATVPFTEMVATQTVVTDTGIRKHRGLDDEFPIVYQKDDLYYIADGHHRLTERWLSGEKTARVWVVDVESWM